jgi:hypothetical protein
MPNDPRSLLVEGEGRLLLLISAFGQTGIEGRTKLAKLDFFVRYPAFLLRALQIRVPGRELPVEGIEDTGPIEARMIRYRYGPWDPSYFTLLGRLIGRGMIAAADLASHEAWESTQSRCKLVKRHFDLQGTTLKTFIYEHFPEVGSARWGEAL